MTNTLHRKGSSQALKQDFVVFALPKRDMFSLEELVSKLKTFTDICLSHHPINMGKYENRSLRGIDPRRMAEEMEDSIALTAVYGDVETLGSVIKALVAADLGISINISGLMDDVQQCCRDAGITRHSAEQSLGIFGRTELLPSREVLEINTLCGHGLVSFNLIQKVLTEIKLDRMSPEEGAYQLARPCQCGVFNLQRAQQLLESMRLKG
ncbi:hypothetical protein KKI24_21970 [bacterium]|nr:hypothetical protein [bacterium]